MKKYVFLVFWFASAVACGQTITGGVYDLETKKGIPGVAVSDQVNVVVTDANGQFKIDVRPGQSFLVISTPDGYDAEHRWFNRIALPRDKEDFYLKKTQVKTEFSFIHASDTHCSEQTVDRMKKFKDIVDKEKPDFVLITGDLVKDALRVSEKQAEIYYGAFVEQTLNFSASLHYVPGNHENFGIERNLSKVSKSNRYYGKKLYDHWLGPNYYSFNYGGIHFIGLDDVDFEDMWYYGHVDAVQLNWMKEDLAVVPKDMPVVTFKHIPMFSGGLSLSPFEEEGLGRTLEVENGKKQFRHVVSNAHEMLEILQTHPYPLSLAGHYHARQVFRYESTGQNTRFEQTGAVVGNGGEGNIIMKSGVVLYKVKNGAIDEGKFIALD